MLQEHADYNEVNNKIYYALKDYREYHHPYLRPLSKLHLNGFFEPTWMVAIGLLMLIAVLILILTSINFINLQTADATSRAKEIGIKKSVGFSVSRLYVNLAMEFLILIFIGMIFSWAAAWYVYRIIPGADKYSLQPGEFLLGTLIIFLVAVGTFRQ